MAGLNVAQIKGVASQKGVNLNDSQAQQILSQAWDQSQYGADAGKVSSILSGYGGGQSNSYSTPSNSAPNFDPVATAQKLLDFQKTANQPAIATLQSTKDDLHSKYQDLVASIKGNQTVAENKQTTATANELGARGILPDSTYGKQEIQNSILPISTGYAGQIANAGVGEQQDMSSLAAKIASLQSGNPESAASTALSLLGLQQGASQFAQELPIKQQQGQYIPIPGVGVYDIKSGQIVNQLNGGASGNSGITYIGGVPYVNK